MTAVSPLPAPETVRAIARRLAPNYDSPSRLSTAVLTDLGRNPTRLRAALLETLTPFLADLFRQERNAIIGELTAPDKITDRPKYRSAKVAGARDWFKRFLAQSLHTESGWQQIGSCTADDLMFAATERKSDAARELFRASQYEALADAVVAAGADTVSELPEKAVRAALDGAK